MTVQKLCDRHGRKAKKKRQPAKEAERSEVEAENAWVCKIDEYFIRQPDARTKIVVEGSETKPGRRGYAGKARNRQADDYVSFRRKSATGRAVPHDGGIKRL